MEEVGQLWRLVDKCWGAVDRCGGRWGIVENGEKMRKVVDECGCGGEVWGKPVGRIQDRGGGLWTGEQGSGQVWSVMDRQGGLWTCVKVEENIC